jgi:hypothetical protein
MTAPSTGLTILVLAKSPEPGRSKTRLAPAYGHAGAAALAAAALADTLDVVAATPAARRVLVLDGDVVPPLPAGFAVVRQRGRTHGDRIAAALAAEPGPALLIGMDTPQVTAALLTPDLAERGVDAWLGPAVDGGWWALGLRHPRRDARRVLAGVPMSTPVTGRVQWDRLVTAGLSPRALPPLRDVDEPDDALAVAGLAPGTRFGRLVRELSAAGAAAPVGVVA